MKPPTPQGFQFTLWAKNAIESYQYQPDASPLQIPILAFAGLDDPRVSRERVEGWALYTEAGFRSQFSPAIISSSRPADKKSFLLSLRR
jgi:alpha-beta hydrolase superfamily lysophospholipase